MMNKVKAINLGYHVTDYDTFLSRELLSDDKVLFLSAQPYDWFPLDNKLFFSMENPAQAERRYRASVVHPDYCVSINT